MSSKFRLIYCFFLVKSWFFIEKVHILRITHFSETTKDRNLILNPLPEVNFLMVEIPTLKPYIYSLVSYLFIKQDQMIMTCNLAVASLMLSRFSTVICCVYSRIFYPRYGFSLSGPQGILCEVESTRCIIII